MRVTFLVHGEDDASVRYRARAFFPRIEAAGIEPWTVEVPKGFLARRRLFRSLSTDRAVVLCRKLMAAPSLALLRRHARRLVYDVDDALWIPDSKAGKQTSITRRARFRRTVRAADLVVAGNALIAAEARRLRGRVEVIPTCVDPARYQVRGHAAADAEERPFIAAAASPAAAFRVVWIGSQSTLFYLEDICATLREAQVPGLVLVVIADRFPEATGLAVERRPWSETTEAADLASCDAAIMPLRDDAWSRGKCGLKALQSMAAGLPIVASPVGVATDIVRDNVDGFLATTPGDWAKALSRLAADPALRARMGAAGRARVEAHWSVDAWADRVVTAVLGEQR